MPAWDPSSHTLLAIYDNDWILPASLPLKSNTQTLLLGPSHAPLQQSIQNLLLDLQLLRIELKVMVNGGKFKQKELHTSLVSVDGQLSI
jgi:hypothetical protein